MPDPARLAALHAAGFSNPRPWSGPEIAGLLAAAGSFLIEQPAGFLIGRVILDEAELLTLVVDPAARRQGIAAGLLRDFAAAAQLRGATRGFLEVAADNMAAVALYSGAGWQVAGRRRGYYRDGPGPAIDALVMGRSFAQTTA